MINLDIIIKRTADYITQCGHDESWYIHPVEFEWNFKREAWAYKENGYNMGCDSLKTILVTPHEELALVLRPEWLPGQRQAVNHYKKRIHFLTEQLIKLGRQS